MDFEGRGRSSFLEEYTASASQRPDSGSKARTKIRSIRSTSSAYHDSNEDEYCEMEASNAIDSTWHLEGWKEEEAYPEASLREAACLSPFSKSIPSPLTGVAGGKPPPGNNRWGGSQSIKSSAPLKRKPAQATSRLSTGSSRQHTLVSPKALLEGNEEEEEGGYDEKQASGKQSEAEAGLSSSTAIALDEQRLSRRNSLLSQDQVKEQKESLERPSSSGRAIHSLLSQGSCSGSLPRLSHAVGRPPKGIAASSGDLEPLKVPVSPTAIEEARQRLESNLDLLLEKRQAVLSQQPIKRTFLTAHCPPLPPPLHSSGSNRMKQSKNSSEVVNQRISAPSPLYPGPSIQQQAVKMRRKSLERDDNLGGIGPWE